MRLKIIFFVLINLLFAVMISASELRLAVIGQTDQPQPGQWIAGGIVWGRDILGLRCPIAPLDIEPNKKIFIKIYRNWLAYYAILKHMTTHSSNQEIMQEFIRNQDVFYDEIIFNFDQQRTKKSIRKIEEVIRKIDQSSIEMENSMRKENTSSCCCSMS